MVARDCAQRLGAIIARPLRDEDDWSIEWTGCGCSLCGTLGTFLGSRSRRVLEWPLAADGRRHVHTRIDSAGLLARHQTRRQGRPYTLAPGSHVRLCDLVETFVHAELMKLATVSGVPVSIWQFRENDNREIDFILEGPGGAVGRYRG